jgi:hypothetical protein
MMQALREWAIVCKALEEGRQIIILRKGGILEYRQGFEIKHEKFFLFPTYEHQSKDHIQQDYIDKFDDVLKEQPAAGTNKMTSYAEVVETKEITEPSALKMLAKYHIWNESYVNARMDYNPSKPMSVILLRAFKLDKPVHISVKPEWAGCRSWIPLDFDLNETYENDISSISSPAIDDLQFGKMASQVKEVLSIEI